MAQSKESLLKELLRQKIKEARQEMDLIGGGEDYGYFYGRKVMAEFMLEMLENPGLVICHLKDGDD